MGYITPGHGTKGKQILIESNEELMSMYDLHLKKKRIILWLKCKAKPSKRSCSEVPQSKRPGHSSLVVMMNEASSIAAILSEKHGEKYNEHQLNCWAHMLQSKKHDSYDTPPKKSFFGKHGRDNTTTVSPSKRLSFRSECLNQLDKWHQLMERGAVSSEEYGELQEIFLQT